MDPRLTVADLLRAGRIRLEACGIDNPRLEAELLLAHALRVDRGRVAMMLTATAPVADDAAASFRGLVRRRCLREPLAYITGLREFRSLELEVGPEVLIPRPETEVLVEEALRRLAPPAGDSRPVVADVGTGSAAVAVALSAQRPDLLIVAIDLSSAALGVAARNLRRHAMTARVHLVQSDLLGPFRRAAGGERGGCFDMVVSNPPYISLAERDALMPEVRHHEPAVALYGGESGMEAIERLAPQAASVLRPGGWLVLEAASERAGRTAELLRAAGVWQEVGVREDYHGLPRVVRARRRGQAGPEPDGQPGGHVEENHAERHADG